MLYQLHALGMEALQPLHQIAKTTRYFYSHPLNPFARSPLVQRVSAGLELYERLTAYYEKPRFGYERVSVDGHSATVREEIIQAYPWCDLVHFRKEGDWKQPKILFVAPMSGHYATLLRNHVAFFLPDFDCYITDWQNARDVPLADGPFHLDDYVEYLVDFIRFIGPDVHLVAVCQPGVPALMATGLMAMAKDPAQPRSLTLLASPIDCRNSPTGVNDYATNRDYEWYERNVIFEVPPGFRGAGQRVYPGFIQLSGFLSLNLDDHIRRHYRFYHDLLKDDGDSAEAHRKFYNEYLAVMDMSAPFYLETIQRVFLEYHLPRRMAHYRDQAIDLDAIRKTALFTLEGGRDDITGPGQTHAAQELCRRLPAELKQQHTEEKVGHYGVFNGGYFRESVGPMMAEFIRSHDQGARKRPPRGVRRSTSASSP